MTFEERISNRLGTFPAIPHDPLARFRQLAVWFAAALAIFNVGLFVFSARLGAMHRLEGGAASALLGAWWVLGYRRGAFPTWGWVVDIALITIVSAWSPMPLHSIGLFYGGIQLRALYVPHRELALLPLSYAIARYLSILYGAPDPAFGVLSASAISQVIGVSIISVTLHLFVEATRHHSTIEHALHHSEERYRLVASAMRDVVYDWDRRAGVVEWTESMQHVLGYAPADVGSDPSWWYERIHPDDRERLERGVNAALGNPAIDVTAVRYRARRADGTYVHVSGTMLALRDEDGNANRVIGSIRDVTNEHQLEEQLRESQKMEAVGQLAGGVAHDFNNLLTVIGGHVYLLEMHVAKTELTDRHLGGITRAAERAATLTRQLPAFSRKQLLRPAVLNMNDVVEDILQMMRPVIGEHIQVSTRFEPTLQSVFADPGQLSQVLVNLLLNGRDAMVSGGTLTIETSNLTLTAQGGGSAALAPGHYVQVSVRDTGSGMDEPTLARAFEPFFTTKPKGAGTGLGLATVYGIVKQSAGDIRIESAPGAGSVFTILLPVTAHVSEPARRSGATAQERRTGQQGDILLVEDDDGVRDFAREVLSSAGYRVQAASNGEEALQQLERGEAAIDLVVTDVVMPKMGGRELVEHLRRARPNLPVLYITGYTDDARMLGALYASDVKLLGKPFTASALEHAVREAGAPGTHSV